MELHRFHIRGDTSKIKCMYISGQGQLLRNIYSFTKGGGANAYVSGSFWHTPLEVSVAGPLFFLNYCLLVLLLCKRDAFKMFKFAMF